MNDYYIMSPLKTFDEPKPSNIRQASDDEIYYKIGNETYLFIISKNSTKKLKYSVNFETKRFFIDEAGNRVSIEKNGAVHLKQDTGATLKVSIESRIANQIAIDLNRKVVYVTAGKGNKPSEQSLYVFNSAKPNKLGGRVLSEPVRYFKDQIISIHVEKASGQILIALTEDNKKWSFSILKPLQTIVCPPAPTVKDVNKKSLLAAINLAAEQIIKVYEDTIPGKQKTNELETEIQRKKVIYTNAGSSRQSMLFDPEAEIEFIDPAADAIRNLNAELVAERKKTAQLQGKINQLFDGLFLSEEYKIMKKKRIDPTPLKSKLANDIKGDDVNNYECVLKDELRKLQLDFKNTNKLLNDLYDVMKKQEESANEEQPELNIDIRISD